MPSTPARMGWTQGLLYQGLLQALDPRPHGLDSISDANRTTNAFIFGFNGSCNVLRHIA